MHWVSSDCDWGACDAVPMTDDTVLCSDENGGMAFKVYVIVVFC